MVTTDSIRRSSARIAQMPSFALSVLWFLIHLVISIFFIVLGIADAVENYLISSGFLKRYDAINVGKLRYLAIVVDSEDAMQINKALKLLQWLTDIGVKHVCLYDSEGVLKKSKEIILERLSCAKLYEEGDEKSVLDSKTMIIEFTSQSDGKEALVRAANLLLKRLRSLGENQEEKIFTEAQMTEALKAVGSGGPEPDLLLVYGPARCHLGFPAWRLRYTEIVHMGPLDSMKYGSLLKSIYNFTLVRQNYGK
ncbi:hypothetical protein SAY86_002651 [Trapa natans]|uniref:ditrans,polycis-polyprenyl diphosphate synthase [(2E,6E)-farnesyldiphosphate specific] n=1 Tax=Trapa natans TaxID=22666 RepID=A0AAN7LU43_TRANT|nr:hypothetical protein SAY86_002651 [Trapa natans]